MNQESATAPARSIVAVTYEWSDGKQTRISRPTEQELEVAAEGLRQQHGAILASASVVETIEATGLKERRAAAVYRITEYLARGGTFNPEMMEHHKVRDLLIECRGALEGS